MLNIEDIAKEMNGLWRRLVLILVTQDECGGNCFTCPYFEECEEDFYADDE